MTTTSSIDTESLLESIVESISIPLSYYKLAEERYQSIGNWLHRDESKVVAFDPHVGVQGSFRYGTVTRPLSDRDEYDLDLFCELQITKLTVTQKALKELVGEEIKAYAERYSFKEPPTEGNRCWRLDYADDVNFHMDILPCVPEDPAVINMMIQLRVPEHLAEKSVAITDKRHPLYAQVTRDWFSSNPRGLGDWFEERAKPAARSRMAHLVENRVYATIDDVPAYEWKTPLQASIQILKRHRDVMFKKNPEWAPISMIITVLAAQAYNGERSISAALSGIIDRMPDHVQASKPRIPNPVNPGEDFADRWAADHRYEQNFWAWYTSVKADIAKLPYLLQGNRLADSIVGIFSVSLPAEQIRRLQSSLAVTVPAAAKVSPSVHIASAPRPWQNE
jgi:Cyclic GMP-AMP synthase DncV-like, nucleotidyltransferase domain